MSKKAKVTMADTADRHALYQRSVQCVEAEIDFIDATFDARHGRKPHLLREDFCGTASTACEWARRRRDNHAIGIDIDAAVLQWGRENNIKPLGNGVKQRVELINADVLSVKPPAADCILAMNFSYWLFKDRKRMKRYFRQVRKYLANDGLFFLDAYGGYDAFRVLRERTKHDDFTYIWHQAEYNPINGDITCHIDFKFSDGSRLKNAFSYHWRLWSLPEIRELLDEAGFSASTVYWQNTDEDNDGDEFYPTEIGQPVAGWIAYIVAEK